MRSRHAAAACLACLVTLAVHGAARAGGPDDLELSRAEIRNARKLAASFRGPGGIAPAMQALCRDADAELPRSVAAVVLVERIREAMPHLLDAIAGVQAPGAHDRAGVWECANAALRVVRDAVRDGGSYDPYRLQGEQNAAVADHRSRVAQRALVGFLAKPGARRSAALRASSNAVSRGEGIAGRCLLPELCGSSAPVGFVDLARPALVALLPSTEDGPAALALIVYLGIEDPAMATAIRPHLTIRNSLPWAALALARTGQDTSAQVAPLLDLVDSPDGDVALLALAAIGPGARAALPRLEALLQRSACALLGRQIASTVSKIASPGDSGLAVRALAPLLACETGIRTAAEAIARYGSDGQQLLLHHLRADDRFIYVRLEIAEALEGRRVKLEADDQDLIRRLRAKKRHHFPDQLPAQTVSLPRSSPLAEASEALGYCRQEAGMPTLAVTGITHAQADALQACLKRSLCGPSQATLRRTLQRCCTAAFHDPGPALCRL